MDKKLKLTDFIKFMETTANQQFSFEYIRPQLEKYITAIQQAYKTNQVPDSMLVQNLSGAIYDALTKRIQTGEDALEKRKTDPLYQKYGEAWKKWLQSAGCNITGTWAQWDIGKRNKVDNKTYNFYITVDFSKEEGFKKFWAGLPALHAILGQIAKQIGDGISFKTSYPFDALMNHNDTLKVYYSDPKFGIIVKQAVQKWAADNQVPLGKRAYEHGTDTQGTSFGDLAAKALSQALLNAIKTTPSATSAQWVSWLNTYAPQVIKNTH